MEEMRQDTTTPDTRLSDDMNHINPATTETLTQLMLGGLPTGRAGYPLHCRVRYFDPQRQRAGLPEDVAALVEGMTADEATLHLVNLNPVQERQVIVQGGAYGEHRIESVTCGQETTDVGRAWFAVRLAPGAGARLQAVHGPLCLSSSPGLSLGLARRGERVPSCRGDQRPPRFVSSRHREDRPSPAWHSRCSPPGRGGP